MKRTWNEDESYIAVNFSNKTTHCYDLAIDGLTFAGQLDAFAGTEAAAEITTSGARLSLPPYAIILLTK